MYRQVVLTAAVVALAVAGLTTSAAAQQRDYIQIVGSSTVYPFTTVVAEQFGKTHQVQDPPRSSPPARAAVSSSSARAVGVEHPT